MKPILYIIFALILFTTCRKNATKPADQHFYYYLSQEQINKTPYFTNPAFDTLTFISNRNDTLIFAKTGTDTLWYDVVDFPPEGVDKYYHYQQLRNRYATLKGEGKFEAIHSKKNDIGNLDIVEFIFNDYIFYVGDHAINSANHPRFIGNVNLNNKVFFNSMFSFKQFTDSSAMCYINLDYGMYYTEEKFNNLTFSLATH